MTKKEMIFILLKYYQYPINKEHSKEYIEKILHSQRRLHPKVKK